MSERLEDIAQAMVAPGKGILAADESTGTIKKRFDSINVESTENRRDYREMLFSASRPCEEHLRRHPVRRDHPPEGQADGKQPLVDSCSVGLDPRHQGGRRRQGPGRSTPARRSPRASTACAAGSRSITSWVPASPSGAPSSTLPRAHAEGNCIQANAHALARYAALCQENGIVPIVEPEVLMDGPVATHDIDRCYEVTEAVLKETFQELYEAACCSKAWCSSRTWSFPARSGQEGRAGGGRRKDGACLKACVPAAVPGIAFLSGGQSDEEATEHLSLMNSAGADMPWRLTFSYGRALQAAALKAWGGKAKTSRPRKPPSPTAPHERPCPSGTPASKRPHERSAPSMERASCPV
jgi:fructose-bisphosphate aldolase, class I